MIMQLHVGAAATARKGNFAGKARAAGRWVGSIPHLGWRELTQITEGIDLSQTYSHLPILSSLHIGGVAHVLCDDLTDWLPVA